MRGGVQMIITATELYQKLIDFGICTKKGRIVFNLGGVPVTITTTDIVGNSIQSWLKQWMIVNDIYQDEPESTQVFPDFYLSPDKKTGLLEVKAFNYNASPAFDIANFESYCDSVTKKAYRLDADYLIFGYTMNKDGDISIEKVWLKKIWEISGTSTRFALNTQVKRDVIYNIRPTSNFKKGLPPYFGSKEQFLKAIYETLYVYRGSAKAIQWKQDVIANYLIHTGQTLEF